MKTDSLSYSLLTGALRVGLVVSLLLSGWLIYSKLPHQEALTTNANNNSKTTLQIILRLPDNAGAEALDVPFELSPVDIVATRHEFFTERRAGKSFDEFINERMAGRTPVESRFDKDGQAVVTVNSGTWWLHVQLAGVENLEWRLKLDTNGSKQIVVLSPDNIYMRSRSF